MLWNRLESNQNHNAEVRQDTFSNIPSFMNFKYNATWTFTSQTEPAINSTLIDQNWNDALLQDPKLLEIDSLKMLKLNSFKKLRKTMCKQ